MLFDSALIEPAIGNFKTRLRHVVACNQEALDPASETHELITMENAHDFFKHAAYPLPILIE